jgi:hypothetical protein
LDSFLPIGFSRTRIKELANLIAWIFKKHGHGEVVAISVLDKLVATLELILAFVMVQQGGEKLSVEVKLVVVLAGLVLVQQRSYQDEKNNIHQQEDIPPNWLRSQGWFPQHRKF